MWNIRKIIKKGDYLYAVVPEHPKATKHGYVLHHRIVMENHLGRELSAYEVVHHKDRDKKNNAVHNLEVMSITEHAKEHHPIGRTMVSLVCAFCGKEFMREKRQVKGKGLCSRKCNGSYNQKYGSWVGCKKI